jgi:hypothetical protein
MSRHYARKVDTTQADIVNGLRACGWLVWIIEWPCDLLCYRAGVWKTLECKTANRKGGRYKPRKDQMDQNDFCEMTNTPRATSPAAAIAALSQPTFTGEWKFDER